MGHSSDTRVAKSAYSPEITGLHEWARGELNHLTAARNPRKDWPVATCPRNDGQSRGTTRYVEVPRRHRVGHVPPEFNPTLASSALGPGELRDSRPGSQDATSGSLDLRFCPQTATVDGRRHTAMARSVTERATGRERARSSNRLDMGDPRRASDRVDESFSCEQDHRCRRDAAERGGAARMWSRTGASRSASAFTSLRDSGWNSCWLMTSV